MRSVLVLLCVVVAGCGRPVAVAPGAPAAAANPPGPIVPEPYLEKSDPTSTLDVEVFEFNEAFVLNALNDPACGLRFLPKVDGYHADKLPAILMFGANEAGEVTKVFVRLDIAKFIRLNRVNGKIDRDLLEQNVTLLMSAIKPICMAIDKSLEQHISEIDRQIHYCLKSGDDGELFRGDKVSVSVLRVNTKRDVILMLTFSPNATFRN